MYWYVYLFTQVQHCGFRKGSQIPRAGVTMI